MKKNYSSKLKNKKLKKKNIKLNSKKNIKSSNKYISSSKKKKIFFVNKELPKLDVSKEALAMLPLL